MKSEWKGPTVPVADKDLWTRFAAVCSALHLKRRGVAADLLAVAMKEWLDKVERNVDDWKEKINGGDEAPIEKVQLWPSADDIAKARAFYDKPPVSEAQQEATGAKWDKRMAGSESVGVKWSKEMAVGGSE